VGLSRGWAKRVDCGSRWRAVRARVYVLVRVVRREEGIAGLGFQGEGW